MIRDPRRAEGKLYQLPYILLFSVLAIVTRANSYRGIHTFIKTHLKRLNNAFKIHWKRRPPIRRSLASEFWRLTARCSRAASMPSTTSRHDRYSAFAVDTALVLAHIEIDEKSNEIPEVQKLLEELDVAG
jgi:hypothetical protein